MSRALCPTEFVCMLASNRSWPSKVKKKKSKSDPNASTGLLAEEALIVLLSRARKGDPVTLEDHVALDVSRNISP